jgi:hypothetical protein
VVGRVECDRCERSANPTWDEWDALVDGCPGCEVAPGVALVRCTAWPATWHEGPRETTEPPAGAPGPGPRLVASRGPGRARESHTGARHWLAAVALAGAVVLASYVESIGTTPTP